MKKDNISEIKTTDKNEGIEIFEDYISVDGYKIYVNEKLREPIMKCANDPEGPIQQFRNISKIPGLCNKIGLPDFHLGYALPIGSVACVDLEHPEASVSPDGVGFDINCGVRCLKTNLKTDQLKDKREDLANFLVEAMPFVCESKNAFSKDEMCDLLENGMDSLLKRGLCTENDIDKTESQGKLPVSNYSLYNENLENTNLQITDIISQAAIEKGIEQLGSLGSGNHYLEFQEVETICDEEICRKLGIFKGQILISVHTGSRGFGHKVCSEILDEIQKEEYEEYLIKEKSAYEAIKNNMEMTREEKAVKYQEATVMKEKLKKELNERKQPLTHVKYNSKMGKKYIQVMNAASNFAWGNRSIITKHIRSSLDKIIPGTKAELVYDVCHNIAKIEKGPNNEKWLVHRKGASRIIPPFHEDLPKEYKEIGQPVLIGGSMGTNSYLIIGDENSKNSIYSTCHGAGRLVSRADFKRQFDYVSVIDNMKNLDIIFRSGSETGMVEECGECYKDVDEVVKLSEKVGISKSVCRVKPVLVIKS